MLIKFSTKVDQSCEKVFAQFDEKLFLELSPPLLPVKLIRFDGCQKNDEVHIEMLFGQKWVSKIIANEHNAEQIYFVDEGIHLPFPLKSWKHFHRILSNKSQTIVIDEIYYQTNNLLIDCLVYPLFWVIFGYRKNIYKKKFAV